MYELRVTAARVLDIIIALSEREGVAPTYDEIAAVYGAQQRAVVVQLEHLERLGYISRRRGKVRGLRVLKNPDGTPYQPGMRPAESNGAKSRTPRPLPDIAPIIEGIICAGGLEEPGDAADEYVPLPWFTPPDSEHFYVRVRGRSMYGEPLWIDDGDVILCRVAPEPVSGQVVAALVDGRATLKRFVKTNGTVKLEPLNRDFPPIVLKGRAKAGLVIQGRAVGVLKQVPVRL